MTVKMRLGWDDQSLTAPALARAFERVGVAGRDRPRPDPRAGVPGGRSTATGIRAVVEAVESIPVVGNGDIRTLADAAAMFAETGCAADLDRPGGAVATRSSSASSPTGPSTATPAPSRRSRSGST